MDSITFSVTLFLVAQWRQLTNALFNAWSQQDGVKVDYSDEQYSETEYLIFTETELGVNLVVERVDYTTLWWTKFGVSTEQFGEQGFELVFEHDPGEEEKLQVTVKRDFLASLGATFTDEQWDALKSEPMPLYGMLTDFYERRPVTA